MVKNKQWLSSLVRLRQCAGLEERGEWEGKKKLRETKERQGEKPHLCQDGFQMDMKTEGQRQTHAEAQAEFWAATSQCLSPFVSCYHNDAELCRLLTSPLGWLEKEAWLCFFSLGRDAHPLKQTLNRMDPSGLSGLCIDLLYTGGPRSNNKQYISRLKTQWDSEWAVFCIVFQFVHNCWACKPVFSCEAQMLWTLSYTDDCFSLLLMLSSFKIVRFSNKYCSITLVCYESSHSSTRVYLPVSVLGRL